jgi:hypothetical protein
MTPEPRWPRAPGRLARHVGALGALLLGLAALLAAWKWRQFFAIAGHPAGGEALVDPQLLVPYSLALTWRSLALGLGAGALGAALASGLAWLQQKLPPEPVDPLPAQTWPIGRIVALVAGIAFTYATLHRQTSLLLTFGDEASYLERGHALGLALSRHSPRALYEWFDLAGHRPWPGLAPAYLGLGLDLPQSVVVGLQAAVASALFAYGLLRLGQILQVRPLALAVALTLGLLQPLWRAEATTLLADAMLTGATLLAIAETVAFLRHPQGNTCIRAALAIGITPAMKPGGIVWAVLPLCLTAGAWLLLVDRKPARLARLLDLAALVAIAVVLALLLGGGPKAWVMIARHGASVEGLGYYDEAVNGRGEQWQWLGLALPRLATVPLLALAAIGAWRGRGPARWAALATVLLPLAIHAFAMESKSLRLLGTALAGLSVLAMLGTDALLQRWPVPMRSGMAICGALVLAVLGLDLGSVASVREIWRWGGPLHPGDWRDVDLLWLGRNPRTDAARTWGPAARQVASVVRAQCRPDATSPLFQDLRLVARPDDSSYAMGLSARHYYTPELQAPFVSPLLEARACLLVHTGGALSWPGGHGRLHGEGLIQQLARLVQDRGDPLAQAYLPVARVELPDGQAIVVYRRDQEATLEERTQWADRLASWMPQAGIWAGLWRDVGVALRTAGRTTEACVQLERAMDARPLRGLVPCERIDVGLCLDATVPAAQAKREALALACPTLETARLWPTGVPTWQAAAQLPRP